MLVFIVTLVLTPVLIAKLGHRASVRPSRPGFDEHTLACGQIVLVKEIQHATRKR